MYFLEGAFVLSTCRKVHQQGTGTIMKVLRPARRSPWRTMQLHNMRLVACTVQVLALKRTKLKRCTGLRKQLKAETKHRNLLLDYRI